MDENDATIRTRPTRVLGLRHLLAVAAVAALIATTATAAFAWTAVFDDVPQTHPFEPEIAWMYNTGISTGWSGSGPAGRDYRPGEPVTRQAMAAFMQRLYNLQEVTRFASSETFTSTSSAAFVDIPGASLTIDVPEGVAANLHVSFSGESACSDGVGSSWCQVRIMVDPPAGAPGFFELGPGGDAAFDSSDGHTESEGSWESHSIDRFDRRTNDAGTYTIKAQYATALSATFSLDDWVMVAETDLEASDYFGPIE